LVKSGGRGFILGDDGSASQIGKRALKAYLDDPATTPRQIREAAVDMFGESTEAQIIQRVHRAASSPALLSRLAKPTGLAAQHGDAVAQEMIRTDLKLLAAILARHTRKYPKKAPMIKLGLAGGLWKSSRVFSEIFLQEVRPLVGQTVEAEVCRRPPVEGAVALAKEIEFGN
jgi:N-acetylglucosamine kinase-like BadF-type ATPase